MKQAFVTHIYQDTLSVPHLRQKKQAYSYCNIKPAAVIKEYHKVCPKTHHLSFRF